MNSFYLQIKALFFFLFVFIIKTVVAQTPDSVPSRGTIKIKKHETEAVYIMASANFYKYDLAGYTDPTGNPPQTFQPFPVVEGHAFPFNYSAFFNEKFKNVPIDLKQKESDTVIINVKVLDNGKVYLKDLSSMMVRGNPVFYNKAAAAYELNELHLNCMNALQKIKEWYPAYIILPKKEKFKNQLVIKPNQKKITSEGTIVIVFSTTPLNEE